MIVKNEEKNIANCLNSVNELVDEIIIVDTGSTDKTREIANDICKNFRCQAKFFGFKWIGDFSAARNESLKHATKDWILVLDADELIDEDGIKKIENAIENPEGFAGFSFEQRSYINNFFEGAVKNEPDFGFARDYQFYIPNNLVRLFKNWLGIYFSHRVHELAEDSIAMKSLKYRKLDAVLHHFGSLKGNDLIKEKAEEYSKMILRQAEESPENARYNYQAARMYLGKNEISNALKYFKKAAKINPGYKAVFSEMAKIYLAMNDKNRAAEYFKKSMKANPANPSPANNLAVVYMSLGMFSQAKKILEEQLKRHPDNKALRYNYERALKEVQKI